MARHHTEMTQMKAVYCCIPHIYIIAISEVSADVTTLTHLVTVTRLPPQMILRDSVKRLQYIQWYCRRFTKYVCKYADLYHLNNPIGWIHFL